MHTMAIAEEMSDMRQPQNKPDSADAHDFACERTRFENIPRLLCKDQSIIALVFATFIIFSWNPSLFGSFDESRIEHMQS